MLPHNEGRSHKNGSPCSDSKHQRDRFESTSQHKENSMTLLKFSRDLKAQAETDSAELLQQVEVRTGANIPELLRPALVAALELSWLGGAQWGLQASAERVASMLPSRVARAPGLNP